MTSYNCHYCGKENKSHTKSKFCNHKCHKESLYASLVAEWKITGKSTRTAGTPGWLKRYLFEKQNSKCNMCHNDTWLDEPITLELEHKDGNSQNDTEDNLELLCPNCHSKTPTYKAKNYGNGRHYRRQLYAAGKSY